MSFPQNTPGMALPTAETTLGAGVALDDGHPLIIAAWLAAGLVVAAGLGPWLSRAIGVMLPAFALVRTKA